MNGSQKGRNTRNLADKKIRNRRSTTVFDTDRGIEAKNSFQYKHNTATATNDVYYESFSISSEPRNVSRKTTSMDTYRYSILHGHGISVHPAKKLTCSPTRFTLPHSPNRHPTPHPSLPLFLPSIPSPHHQLTPSSIKYPVPTQESSNASVSTLELRCP
ncbi:hypothetical protein EVAR_49404_1 [Eumeta japonica]|uniref:Uncharacterized protein n=1 Tax=Eumeta variegata TaxID=151549 RepID=A0A4C1Y590_EUMVA|nr:hypothetical protein EVAR_49404_1 [Eumeta japonica]